MEDRLAKPPIMRLARKAGIKSMSDECYDTIRDIIDEQLSEVSRAMLIANSERQTKTIMVGDVYDALRLRGENLTESSEVGTTTCAK